MQTIKTFPGDHIDRAAALLVASAPARADFNGITIRARYATTRPCDIAARYHRLIEARSIQWRHSPEGKRYEAERDAHIAEAQSKIDFGMALLPKIDFGDCADVLAWVEAMAEACDVVGVQWTKSLVLSLFSAGGWEPVVNCYEHFNADDARNVAGWIVGQWLESGYPNLHKFCDDWRAKFANAGA